MAKLNFQKGDGGLNRKLAGTDHISGILFYVAALPSGFTVDVPTVKVTKIGDVAALGLTATAVALQTKIIFYHVAEFFRVNPGATLFISCVVVPVGVHTFAEVTSMRDFAEGSMRQLGVYTTKAFDPAQITLLEGQAEAAETANRELEIVYSPNIYGITAANLNTLRTLNAKRVTVSIGQDGAGMGAALFATNANVVSVGCIGAAIGAISAAKVNECIGWVEKFDMSGINPAYVASTTIELGVPALANGTLVKNLGVGVADNLDVFGYVFLMNYTDYDGTYFNDSHTAISTDSDYCFIEKNRTMAKACRGIRKNLLPQLNGPVYVDATTGNLTPDNVTYLETLGNKALNDMDKAGELSGHKVVIDPDQDVLSTDQITINIINVPVGVTRSMLVKISYATAI